MSFKEYNKVKFSGETSKGLPNFKEIVYKFKYFLYEKIIESDLL